jgi:hypothetical protein
MECQPFCRLFYLGRLMFLKMFMAASLGLLFMDLDCPVGWISNFLFLTLSALDVCTTNLNKFLPNNWICKQQDIDANLAI